MSRGLRVAACRRVSPRVAACFLVSPRVSSCRCVSPRVASCRRVSPRLAASRRVSPRLAASHCCCVHTPSVSCSLSQSTLSVSSGSSRGSLGSLSASSRGSLNSASLCDIYAQMGGGGLGASPPAGAAVGGDVNLPELHRRVEKLLQGHTVCISPIHEVVAVDAPAGTVAPPTYAQHVERRRGGAGDAEPEGAHLAAAGGAGRRGPPEPPPLSPISETSSGVCHQLSSPGGGTRSVSAAVSDDSVAGDSGVFEAAVNRWADHGVTTGQLRGDYGVATG